MDKDGSKANAGQGGAAHPDTRPAKSERPLSWTELQDRLEARPATEEVPTELRSLWSDLSVTTEARVHRIERPKEPPPRSVEPFRPPWIGLAAKPESAPRGTPPSLSHRGQPVEPLVVWGKDDRKIYSATNFPWRSVCKVIGTTKKGSGVLIGTRHVLTASHVVDWDGPGETIEVHRAGGSVLATAKTVLKFAFTQITGDPGVSTVDEDYAILIVDQPLGKKFGYLGIKTYDSSWDDDPRWCTMGYAGDVAGGDYPVWQNRKELDEDEWDWGPARAMTTTADLMRGQSGSPMFGFWGEKVYVVAIASAVGNIALSGTENWCSGGSYLTSLVQSARQMFP